MRPLFRLVLGVGLGVFLLSTESSAVTFVDGAFSDLDWSASKIFDSTPLSNATFSAGQSTSGGTPGAFRQTQHTWTGPGGFIIGHMNANAVYDPGILGAIAAIDFSFDLRFLGGSTGTSQVGYQLVIEQNGSFFSSSGAAGIGVALRPGSGQPGTWSGFSASGFGAGDFAQIGGTSHPDFSASGSTLTFGVVSSNGEQVGNMVSTASGLDNWTVI